MAIITIEDLKKLLDRLEGQGPNGKTELLDMAVSINRTNPVPLDNSTIIVLDPASSTFEGEAQKYAETNPIAYPGQHLTVAAPKETRSFILQPNGYLHNLYFLGILIFCSYICGKPRKYIVQFCTYMGENITKEYEKIQENKKTEGL